MGSLAILRNRRDRENTHDAQRRTFQVPGRNSFPLLLFPQGRGNATFLYIAELEDIVSHGHILAAVEHLYDTASTLFPNGDVGPISANLRSKPVAASSILNTSP